MIPEGHQDGRQPAASAVACAAACCGVRDRMQPNGSIGVEGTFYLVTNKFPNSNSDFLRPFGIQEDQFRCSGRKKVTRTLQCLKGEEDFYSCWMPNIV